VSFCFSPQTPQPYLGTPTPPRLRSSRSPFALQAKCVAMKSCILAMLNGEKFPRVMMTVIRFCVNTESKELKKLLTLYWEVRKLSDYL
jgi:coatomer subunit beta